MHYLLSIILEKNSQQTDQYAYFTFAASLQNMHKPLARLLKINDNRRRLVVTDINHSKIYHDPKIAAKILPKLTLLCSLALL